MWARATSLAWTHPIYKSSSTSVRPALDIWLRKDTKTVKILRLIFTRKSMLVVRYGPSTLDEAKKDQDAHTQNRRKTGT